MKNCAVPVLKLCASAAGFALGGYCACFVIGWFRYGVAAPPKGQATDRLLDRCVPDYEVADQQSLVVSAPAHVTFETACQTDLLQSPIVRGIFSLRQLLLGGRSSALDRPVALAASMSSIGWSVLAEIADREIVFGTVTQPWRANVVFHSLSLAEFLAFKEPRYVKIAWTLRSDEITPARSIASTETRVITTDSVARAKFRWYWACFSPGIRLIHRLLLRQVRTDAERCAREKMSA